MSINTALDNEKRVRCGVGVTAALLLGYYIIGLGANLCFKEGGTDPAHHLFNFITRRLFFFIIGNVLGITSTALLMGVYARMQVNLAMVLATSGSFALVQCVFWLVYHSPLTWLQGVGIALVGVGTTLAACAEKKPATMETAVTAPEESC